ncbi:LuxR C-terminal-related transcriptional regulator [Serratia sp. Res13-Sevr-LER1-36-b]|uniref:LuxR C-terminal-related transcriptional regulator n=2 Tax=unclassified Serratia (in: enterobacteria) TaxID=2647522 RepID=UPI0018AA4729|nr:LuxR C-terminal-related transcriptional regulator [Serratia sp. Res13-Sevr-LER1-36-b]
MNAFNLSKKNIILTDLTPVNAFGVRSTLESVNGGDYTVVNINNVWDIGNETDRTIALVILSISKECGNTLDSIKKAWKISSSGIPVLLFSDVLNAKLYALIASLGINGVMFYKESSSVFLDILFSIMNKERRFGPYVLEQMDWKVPALLTPAETNLVFDLLEGKRVTDIAKKNGRNIKTISTQKTSIMKRLNINNNSEFSALGGVLNRFSFYT